MNAVLVELAQVFGMLSSDPEFKSSWYPYMESFYNEGKALR